MEVLYPHCAGLDVHKETVVACMRHMVGGTVKREVRTFDTITTGLLALADWLASERCTDVVMEATGVYWKPVWDIRSDGGFTVGAGECQTRQKRAGPAASPLSAWPLGWQVSLPRTWLIRGSFVPVALTLVFV